MGACRVFVRIIATIFVVGSFVLFMIAMTTNHWRGNSRTILPEPTWQLLAERQANVSGYTWLTHHGLWWVCKKPPNERFRIGAERIFQMKTGQVLDLGKDCPRIEKSADKDRNRQGNSTRILIAGACMFSFITLLLEIIRLTCCRRSSPMLAFLAYLFAFMTLLCGISGMAIFTRYFPNCYQVPGDWREYRWSYYLGWSACVVIFVPLQIYLAEIFGRDRKATEDFAVANSYAMK